MGINFHSIEEIEQHLNRLGISVNCSYISDTVIENPPYVGDLKFATLLLKHGIKPYPIHEKSSICSIGFCEKEQKWYGWSHRAMYGFTIGSTVKKGDCAYTPKDAEDFIQQEIYFWSDSSRVNVHHAKDELVNGELVATIQWSYRDESYLNTSINSISVPYPKAYGRGEWSAETLDDAKQMAIDFANGVA